MGNKSSTGAQSASRGVSANAYTGVSTGSSKGAFGPPPEPTHKYTTKSQLRLAIKKYEDLIANNAPRLPDDQYKFGFAPFNPETDFDLLTVENTDPKIINSRGELSDDDTKNVLYTNKLVERFNVIYPNVKHEWGGGARKRRRRTRKVKGKKSRKNNKK